jgi:hypothetical protein
MFDIQSIYEKIKKIAYTFPAETSFIQPPAEFKNIVQRCLQYREQRIKEDELLTLLEP